MYRKFIATVAAAAIAVTGIGATPAAAGDDDVARALAAIVGLAIVGAAINDAKQDRRAQHRRVQPRHSHRPHHVAPKPLPPRVSRHLLPGDCLRSFGTYEGRVRLFTQRCLQRNYRFVNSLPSRCYRRIETSRGQRYGYSPRCLRRSGYQLAHR